MSRSAANHAFFRFCRRATVFAVCLCLVWLSAVLAHAEDPAFVMVVHPSNPASSVERAFLSDAFLKKKTRWPDDEAIYPVDLRLNSATRQHFSKRIHARSVAAVRSYWQQRIFSGRGVPPPELEDDSAVVRYVLKHPGAVGYVRGDTPLKGVKVLQFH